MNSGPTLVARVADAIIHGPIDFREVAANARLIAAAPELLAALRELEWAHTRLLASEWGGCEPDEDERIIHSGELARAAIAKTKGGA